MTQLSLFPMDMTFAQFAELIGVFLRTNAEQKAEPMPELAKAIVEKIVEGIPVPVVAAIAKAWPDQATEILASLKRCRDYYFFERWSMYVGIEPDGYIHT